MAGSTCLPSIISCRVYSIQLFSHGRGTSYSPLYLGSKVPSFAPLSSSPPRSSVITFLRPRNRTESRLASKRKPPKKKTALDDFMEEEEQEYIEEEKEEESDEEGEDEEYPELDVLNAFFSKLEKDINNHNSSDDDDDEDINEEDLMKFEKELTQALGETGLELEEDDSDSEGFDEENDFQLPELKTWQMKKLARALKVGRRKASIKQLSEDVALDRATVLEYLRNPPPSLLLMSDSLPDEPTPEPPTEPESSEMGSSISMDGAEVESQESELVGSKETEPEVKKQVHPVQRHPQKRLKKVQVETLERVYFRAKRPTDEIISSIVHVTNLPRRVILDWFEKKREQDGIPEKPVFHSRYQRRYVARTLSRR